MFIGLAQVKSTEVQCAISPADDFEGGREGGRDGGREGRGQRYSFEIEETEEKRRRVSGRGRKDNNNNRIRHFTLGLALAGLQETTTLPGIPELNKLTRDRLLHGKTF